MSASVNQKGVVITATAVVSAAVAVASLAAHIAVRIAKRRREAQSAQSAGDEEPITVGVAEIYLDSLNEGEVECFNPQTKPIAVCFQKQSSSFWESENGQGISYRNETTVYSIDPRGSVDIAEDIADHAQSGQMSTNMLEDETPSDTGGGAVRYVRIFSSVWSASSVTAASGKYEITKNSPTTFMLKSVAPLSAARFSFHDENNSTANFSADLSNEGAPGSAWAWEYEIEAPAGISAGGLIKDFSLGLTMSPEAFEAFADKRPLIAYKDSLAFRHAQGSTGA